MPNFAFAQQAQNQGKALKSEVIEGEGGKAYTAFHLDGYTVADIFGYGPRLRAAGEEIPGFTLELSWVGRSLKEFPFPEGGIELRLTPKSDATKVIATITYTKDDIYSEIVKDPDGTEHYVGRPKGPKKFKKTEAFTQALLDEGVDMQIPYGISFHPELFATTFGTQTFILSLEQKCNPLWTTEWNVSDKYKEENKKPEIRAFYKDQGSNDKKNFVLPKNDNVYSMQSSAPQGMYWDGKDTINIWEKSNPNLHPVIVGDKAEDDLGRSDYDYTGALSDDALLLVSDAANPRPYIGFGTHKVENKTGFYQKDANSPKFLLNTYPTPEQINTPSVYVTNKVTGKKEPAYRQIKRYAVYEALNVKFNTGEGKLAADGEKNADIGQPQEIGYSEKIAGNESGRKINLPTDKLIPPEKPASQKTDNEFIGWALTKDATQPLFKTQAEADQYAQAFEEDTTFYAIYKEKAQGKALVRYDIDGTEKKASEIDAKYKLEGEDYPTEVTGNVGEKIADAVFVKKDAPKLIGFEIDNVLSKPVPPVGKTANYTENGDFRVIYKYKKADSIIPAKTEDGSPNPKVTEDVKATYIPVTWMIADKDKENGEFKKGTNAVTDTKFTYYVNPVEKKTFSDVVTASGLLPAVKEVKKDVAKLDTENPNKFTPDKVKKDKNDTTPSLVVDNGTEINYLHFTVKDGLVATVNFEQTTAEKLKGKLKPVPIKVWVGDQITWKDGVELNDANKGDETLKGLLAEATVTDLGVGGTLQAPGTLRNSDAQNLPDGKTGSLKLAFGDGSALAVDGQTLYVAGPKNKVVEGDDTNTIKPENLPTDKIAVKFLLGEGVKIGDKQMKETDHGPVLYETYYVKPNTSLEAGDIPATTLQDNYKGNEWYNGANKLVTADYENITEAKEFTAKAVLKGQGSAELAFVDDKGAAIDILNTKKDLKLPNQDYVQASQGKDGAEITYDKSKAPKILGYEFTNEEPVISPKKFKEGAKATITLKYKKIDDIIGPNKPADQKPEGYVTVAFKATTGAELDPSEMSYFVNPVAVEKAKVSKVDDNYQISGKKADGTDLTGNVPAVNSTDASKYELKYADADKKWAYDNFDKVGQDLTTDTTFTAQVTKIGEPNVTFPDVEIEKGGSKEVTPDPRDKYGKKITNPVKPENLDKIEKPGGVNVTVDNDGKIKIEVPKDYNGPGNFTIKIPYKIDEKEITGEIKVTIKEDKKPEEPRPSAPAITWKGYWYLGDSKTEPVQPKTDMEIGRHYKYLYGYVDKTVRPEGMITRSEAAALIARLANLDMTDKTKPNFKDTPSAWYNGAINAMVAKNLMFADKDGNFRPNEPITRGEFARALYYIDKKNDKVAPFADVKGHEFEDAINQAYGNGRIAGYQDGTFKPNANIQRAEAARILNQFADRNVTLDGLRGVKNDLVRFTDINESHWAYCEVMEAANSHEYQRAKGTLAETWLKILDK